jgi:hypothetical protein
MQSIGQGKIGALQLAWTSCLLRTRVSSDSGNGMLLDFTGASRDSSRVVI